MMPIRLSLTLAALFLTACDTPVPNNADNVYPTLTGILQLRYTQTVTGVKEVDYTLDGQILAKSTEASTQFSTKLDTAKYPNGKHLLHVAPIDARGVPLPGVIDNTLVFQN